MEDEDVPVAVVAPGGDFTVPELYAMVLDGVLAPVFGTAFRPVGVPETAGVRAAAAAAWLPPSLASRTALARMTAAWVHGWAPPPAAVDLVVGANRRCGSLPPHSAAVLHEVKLGPHDVVRCGGALVTTALRTAVDIATTVPAEAAVPVLRTLAAQHVAGCSLNEVREAVSAAVHMPGRRTGLRLLDGLLP